MNFARAGRHWYQRSIFSGRKLQRSLSVCVMKVARWFAVYVLFQTFGAVFGALKRGGPVKGRLMLTKKKLRCGTSDKGEISTVLSRTSVRSISLWSICLLTSPLVTKPFHNAVLTFHVHDKAILAPHFSMLRPCLHQCISSPSEHNILLRKLSSSRPVHSTNQSSTALLERAESLDREYSSSARLCASPHKRSLVQYAATRGPPPSVDCFDLATVIALAGVRPWHDFISNQSSQDTEGRRQKIIDSSACACSRSGIWVVHEKHKKVPFVPSANPHFLVQKGNRKAAFGRLRRCHRDEPQNLELLELHVHLIV